MVSEFEVELSPKFHKVEVAPFVQLLKVINCPAPIESALIDAQVTGRAIVLFLQALIKSILIAKHHTYFFIMVLFANINFHTILFIFYV
jgi:hypothetical protein